MPNVRELSDETAGVAAPASTVSAPTGAAQGAPATQLAVKDIPAELDVFGGADFTPVMPADDVTDQLGSQYGAYIGFAHSSNKNYAELQQLGIKEGDIYLAYNGQITKQMPLCGWLVSAEVFATTMAITGDMVFASRDLNKVTPPGVAPRIEEHIVALFIVDTPEGLIPAKGDFRGVKAGGLTNAMALVKFASKPEFSQRSTANRIAAQFSKPWGRIYTRITTSFRTSKSTGKPYHPANGIAKAADVDQLTRLATALTDDAFMNAAELAKQAYTDKVTELTALCDKK